MIQKIQSWGRKTHFMSKVFKSKNCRQLEPNGYNSGTKDIRLENREQRKQSELFKLVS